MYKTGGAEGKHPSGRSGGCGPTHQLHSLLAGGLSDWPNAAQTHFLARMVGPRSHWKGLLGGARATEHDWVISSWPSGTAQTSKSLCPSPARARLGLSCRNVKGTGLTRGLRPVGETGEWFSHSAGASLEYKQNDTDSGMRLRA